MKTATARRSNFAHLICLEASRQASGIVVALRGKLKRIFCFERGAIVFATSNLIEEQFVEVLVRTNILDPSRRAEVVEEAARCDRRASEILIASGSPPIEDLRRGMENLVGELLASTLEWPDGDVSFEEGIPQLEGEVTVQLAVVPLVLRHARRYPSSADALRVRLGPPDLRPAPTANAEQILGAADLDPVSLHLLQACDGERDLGALISDSSVSEEPTLRAIYGLMLAGILEPSRSKRRLELGREKQEAPLTRDECLSRLRLTTAADHYGVLGLERLAPPEQVRDAYYALARRYHPDRFRSGALQDLLDRFEEYFSRVTDAYNTLSEPNRRREYDEGLLAGVDTGGPKLSETALIARQNYQRGRALAHMRKWTDAATFLENAVRLEDGNADYNLEAGLLLVRNPRRRADAERYLLRVAELAPANVKSYIALGQLYARAGHTVPAASVLREALRWEPDNFEAQRLLGALGAVPEELPGSSARQPVFKS